MLAQVETVRVVQVIDPKVYMTQGLPFDVQRVGTPHSGSDKNRFVAVAEQIVNGDGSADGRVWTNFDIFQDQMAVLEIIENAFGKPEFRNAVAQDAADLVLAFKNRDLIALARQKDSDGQAGRTGTDDRHTDSIGRSRTFDHFGTVGTGNIVFDG